MTPDVSESTSPEIPPAAPFEWYVCRIVGPLRRGPQPHVPIQGGRHWWCIARAGDSLRPIFVEQPVRWAVGPGMHFAHISNRAIPNRFAQSSRSFRRLALVPHLCHDFVFARSICDLARFPNRMRERLLAIHMLPKL